jgi:hypothetical protein
MSWLKGELRALMKGWNHFWFESRSDSTLRSLGLFRICFGSVMLVFYLTRIPDLAFFYGEDGIMPLSHLSSLDFLAWHPTIFTWLADLWAIQLFHALFCLALLTLTLGLFTRASAIAVYFLQLMFLNRNVSVMFGVDTIGTFFFLYLCFADSGARYSLDEKRGKGPRQHSALSHIAWRLMQLQVCIIYAYSGLEKLKGSRWWDGSALWDVLSIGNMQRWDLSFVAHFPILLAGAVYVLLLWELYFSALIWVPRLRLPMLAFGVFLHIGIFVFMNLPSFGFMMMAMYVLFLKGEEVERMFARLPAFPR